MNESILMESFYIGKEIGVASRKFKYFTHHAERCKKSSDKINLAMLAMISAAYMSILLEKQLQNLKELTEFIYGS